MTTSTSLLSRGSERVSRSISSGLPADTSLKFDYLETMLTEFGLWQHSEGPIPNRRFGFSIDDEARALIAALGYWTDGVQLDLMERMGRVSFEFIEEAACPITVGRFHNFRDEAGGWLDTYGSDDSLGRTLWSLGVAFQFDAPFAPRERAGQLIHRSLPVVRQLVSPRAIAFTILGLSATRQHDVLMRRLADRLVDNFDRHSEDGWLWFENAMTYCNARLPQALFLASARCPDARNRYLDTAISALDFLLDATRNEYGSYSPVGNAPMSAGNWFCKGQAHPPIYDQQPVDAGALVECCVAAYLATDEPRFRTAAYDAYDWYFGRNVHNVSVYDSVSGGVADALTKKGLNRNMGAESVLSVHMAHLALNQLLKE